MNSKANVNGKLKGGAGWIWLRVFCAIEIFCLRFLLAYCVNWRCIRFYCIYSYTRIHAFYCIRVAMILFDFTWFLQPPMWRTTCAQNDNTQKKTFWKMATALIFHLFCSYNRWMTLMWDLMDFYQQKPTQNGISPSKWKQQKSANKQKKWTYTHSSSQLGIFATTLRPIADTIRYKLCVLTV